MTPEFPITPKFKQYIAILSQTGTANPTANVIHNTIGNIVWTRGALGQYDATLVGAFKTGKTICPPFVPDGGIIYQMIGGATATEFNYTIIVNDENSLTLSTGKTDFTGYVELSSLGTSILVQIIVKQ